MNEAHKVLNSYLSGDGYLANRGTWEGTTKKLLLDHKWHEYRNHTEYNAFKVLLELVLSDPFLVRDLIHSDPSPTLVGEIVKRVVDSKNGYKEIKTEMEAENGVYPYIPFNTLEFMEIITGILKKFPDIKSFIDVGSGLGSKPLLVSSYFKLENVYGLELTRETYYQSLLFPPMLGFVPDEKKRGIFYLYGNDYRNYSQKNYKKHSTLRYILGNGFTYDFSKFDLLYLYVPCSRDKGMMKLVDNVLRTMKEGAVVYDVGGMGRYVHRARELGKMGTYKGGVIRKTKESPMKFDSVKFKTANFYYS